MTIARVTSVADCLKGPPGASDTDAMRKFLDSCVASLELVGITFFLDSGTTKDRAMSARNLMLDTIDKINLMREEALSHGYLVPDEPFTAIGKLNSGRNLFAQVKIDASLANSYAESAKDLGRLFTSYDKGEIDFSVPKGGTGQISSFDLSVDGFGVGTGDALADIIGYQPDADLLKRKRAVDALSALDFKRRRPRMLFISDVDDGRTSAIMCWRRMRDASGYRIFARNVFTDETFSSAYNTKDLVDGMSSLPIDEALSFYDDVSRDDVIAVKIDGLERDVLYAFSVEGTQKTSGGGRTMFQVPTSPIYLSPVQMEQLQDSLSTDAETMGQSSTDSVSPYPAISQILYGDSRYDWVLAAMNFLTGRSRGERDDEVRSASYLGARMSWIQSRLAGGLVVAPDDISTIVDGVESSISSFGISQTILDVIDATGVGLFIASKDDPSGYQDSQIAVDIATGGLAKILASIDPETATLDPTVLISNLSASGGRTGVPQYRSREIVPIIKTMNVVGQPTKKKPLTVAELIGTEIIDLTTYEGISRLMRAIRVFYDVSSLRF